MKASEGEQVALVAFVLVWGYSPNMLNFSLLIIPVSVLVAVKTNKVS